ncbi:MAG TPA: sulfate ABC transporter substrate-binding protein [Candidatus Eisenbacteria bacterium]|nr:sulfate ABC transporter substrate-binding protein [Candidatus Eisenbacteria bacterium]
MSKHALLVFVAAALLAAAPRRAGALELLNVSYDPTRELYRAVNEAFVPRYKAQTGAVVTVRQSHGGSGSQARAVLDGLEADVVTLAMWTDTNAIAKAGLMPLGWEKTLPNDSLPYTSTIVFVVRKGNPKNIHDWPDIVQPGVEIVTPNPKTSGNGKLSFLAAWGSVVTRGGSDADALAFLKRLYEQVPVLDLAARAATTTFVQKNIGDVHLAWENEAELEVQEANGAVEIVYPPTSFLAEPYVAIVTKNAEKKGNLDAAKAYLEFLYTPEGQEIIAKNFYRPTDPQVLAKYRSQFPDLKLFKIDAVAKGWDDASAKFFADGGLFDSFYKPKK